MAQFIVGHSKVGSVDHLGGAPSGTNYTQTNTDPENITDAVSNATVVIVSAVNTVASGVLA